MLVSFVCYAFNLTLLLGRRDRDALPTALSPRVARHLSRYFSHSALPLTAGLYILLGGIIFTFGIVQLLTTVISMYATYSRYLVLC